MPDVGDEAEQWLNAYNELPDPMQAIVLQPGVRWGSDRMARTMHPITNRRRAKLCPCGCRTRSTHFGAGGGVTLTSGCEAWVTAWVSSDG